jgi:uncharacterized protein
MTRDELLAELRAQLPYLRETYHITTLGLFGSYARNEQTPDSDVDLVYELEPGHRMTMFQFMDMEDAIKVRLAVNKLDMVRLKVINPGIAYTMRKDVIYV